jgi:hypothetical protein
VTPALDFLARFFEGTRHDIELRTVPEARQCFTRDAQQLGEFLERHQKLNLYFGCGTREGKQGDAEHTREFPALYTDVDFKEIAEAKARLLIKKFPHHPSIIIRSGGGLHAYWLLQQPVEASYPRLKQILAGIAQELHGDPACAELARILRVPGTLNHKYHPAPEVTLERAEWTTRFNIAEFSRFAIELPPANGAGGFAEGEKVPKGKQQPYLVSLAAGYRYKGDDEETMYKKLCVDYVQKCAPPHDNYPRIRQIAKSFAKYPAGQKLNAAEVCPEPLLLHTTEELFAGTAEEARWVVWPLFAPGNATILDGLPKAGKTEFILRGLLAALREKPFLGHATEPICPIYISEQSQELLSRQAKSAGFLPADPVKWLWRSDWVRMPFAQLLESLKRTLDEIAELAQTRKYNAIVWDTWHMLARLKDEADASEVNTWATATLELADSYQLMTLFSRHERKIGGEPGVGGINSIRLSGMMDTILTIGKLPGKAGKASPNARRIRTASRLPLPAEFCIELTDAGYVLHEKVAIKASEAKKKILAAAPQASEAAASKSVILKAAEVGRSGAVHKAFDQLVASGELRQREITKKKKVFWRRVQQPSLYE